MRNTAWLAGLAVLVIGCSQGASEDALAKRAMPEASLATASEAMAPAAAMDLATANEGSSASTEVKVPERAVVRSGSLTVRVPKLEQAERVATGLVSQLNGYAEGSQSSDLAGPNAVITMSLKVPVGRFQTLIARCEALGVRESKTVTSQDVTGQLVDLDARVRSLRAEESSYQGMLTQARRLDDIIPLRTRLTELRSTIESIAGQRKALGDQAAMSSLSLTLRQDSVSLAATQKGDNWLATTWTEAANLLFVFGRVVVTVGIYAIMFGPFMVLIGWLGWRLWLRPAAA
jgi:hypothetical protein